MDPSLLILLVGLLYILGFAALSFVRRQGLSTRFATEDLIITTIGGGLAYASLPVHPLLFLIIIFVLTMRVRLLVDLGNWLASRGRFEQALETYRFALRLGADDTTRRIVLINRGVAQLRTHESEAARLTQEALADEQVRAGAKYLAAGYYNLGLACRRTGHEAEAIRHFNQAIDAWPNSIYARAAKQALKKGKTSQVSEKASEV